jgi:hypothetical protein
MSFKVVDTHVHVHEFYPQAFQLSDGGYRSITLKGTIMGCGVIQMHGLSSLAALHVSTEDIKQFYEFFEEKIIIGKLKPMRIGAIIMVMGQPYFSNRKLIPIIKMFGFEEVSVYSNYVHNSDGSYKQKLYIRKL